MLYYFLHVFHHATLLVYFESVTERQSNAAKGARYH